MDLINQKIEEIFCILGAEGPLVKLDDQLPFANKRRAKNENHPAL
jgi:hypothetical protein